LHPALFSGPLLRTLVIAALSLAAAGCAHVQSAILPIAAEISGSVDGAAIVGEPPGSDIAAAEATAMHGIWA
jgi:hypothetical protein